jgi:predicted phosphodiesterase
MADPVEIRDGDIVLVHRVELYYARVERGRPRDVLIQPLDPRIADSRVRLTEIKRVFRDVGVPGISPSRLRPGPTPAAARRRRRARALMRVCVFADPHAHADALRAVMRAAVDADVQELWCLGDLVGSGPDPAEVVAMVRAYCTVALVGNHDYSVTGAVDPTVIGPPSASHHRSLELARAALEESGDLDWLRSRKPAARRHGVQCWHASPRNPVSEFVSDANAEACLQRQRARIGLVGHSHVAAAWRRNPDDAAERIAVRVDRPLELGNGRWLLNPGAVGAPAPSTADWRDALVAHAIHGAWWLELDLDAPTATWRRVPYDPLPALRRSDAAGLLRHLARPHGDATSSVVDQTTRH